jgi:hypothetical protein
LRRYIGISMQTVLKLFQGFYKCDSHLCILCIVLVWIHSSGRNPPTNTLIDLVYVWLGASRFITHLSILCQTSNSSEDMTVSKCYCKIQRDI